MLLRVAVLFLEFGSDVVCLRIPLGLGDSHLLPGLLVPGVTEVLKLNTSSANSTRLGLSGSFGMFRGLPRSLSDMGLFNPGLFGLFMSEYPD